MHPGNAPQANPAYFQSYTSNNHRHTTTSFGLIAANLPISSHIASSDPGRHDSSFDSQPQPAAGTSRATAAGTTATLPNKTPQNPYGPLRHLRAPEAAGINSREVGISSRRVGGPDLDASQHWDRLEC